MESGKVYTVVEDLRKEDTNVLDNCGQLLSNYKRLDLFDRIVKTEVVCVLHWVATCIHESYQLNLLTNRPTQPT